MTTRKKWRLGPIHEATAKYAYASPIWAKLEKGCICCFQRKSRSAAAPLEVSGTHGREIRLVQASVRARSWYFAAIVRGTCRRATGGDGPFCTYRYSLRLGSRTLGRPNQHI